MIIHAFDRVLVGLASAGTVMGMAIMTFGQAIIDPSATAVERYVGGGILLAVAVIIVRWTFNLIVIVRDNAEADRKAALEKSRQDHAAALERESMLLNQMEQMARQLAESNQALTTERSLRMSLEKAGIHDRREPPQ